MNRKEKRSIKAIILSTITIIVSFFIWDSFDITALSEAATSYNNIPIGRSIDNIDTVLYGNEINNEFNVNLNNMNNNKKSTKLYFVVDRQSSYDINNLTIKIDNIELNINDSYTKSDKNYDYYFIDTIELNNYENKNINVNFEDNKSNSNDLLIFDFINRD